jgi:serine protease AprX
MRAKTVLMIDDEKALLDATSDELKYFKYNVLTATDGEAGLVKVYQEMPDVIVLDLMMPKMDGYDFCRKLRADKEMDDIPIIVLTAVPRKDLENEMQALGAQKVIRKDYDFGDKLKIAIEDLVGRKQEGIKECVEYRDLVDRQAFKRMEEQVLVVLDESKKDNYRTFIEELKTIDLKIVVADEEFLFASVALPPNEIEKDNVKAKLATICANYGAELGEDCQFQPDFADSMEPQDIRVSTEQVLKKIEAFNAWYYGGKRGEGVAIAIIDSGINGDRPEFTDKIDRGNSWANQGDDPCQDLEGHGTMCAAIAAGTKSNKGIIMGVAPNAALISCKIRGYLSELILVYQHLAKLAELAKSDKTKNYKNIVALNSWSRSFENEQKLLNNEPLSYRIFNKALTKAIGAGVKVVFSAGNYHRAVGGEEDRCRPNSIWMERCRADVLTVATCDMEGKVWGYSSRGPGKTSGTDETNKKPDITAPTPQNGIILYGDQLIIARSGWGTSGAAAQVAGLVALMLSVDASLTMRQISEIIRRTATSLSDSQNCVGAGLVNCFKAVSVVQQL